MRFPVAVALIAAVAISACSADTTGVPLLTDDASLAKLDVADQGGRPLSTTLSGAEEVPPRNTPATGTFVMTLNQGQQKLCYELTWTGLLSPARAAHIHIGAAGTNGPIVVPLTVTNTTSGATSECVTVSKDLIKDIRQNPEMYYVNLHTGMFPGGEIRGQLSK